MATVEGGKAIAELLGIKRIPTISRWLKRHKDCPIVKDQRSGRLRADVATLKAWALKNKKIQPSSPAELEIASEKDVKLPTIEEVREKIGVTEKKFDDFINRDKWDDYQATAGSIEEEIEDARKLKNLFGRIVYAWKPESLANPRMAKDFQGYAGLFTRQIAVIAKLEEALTKQRIRQGVLLDEETVVEFARALSESNKDTQRRCLRDCFEIVLEEVRQKSNELGVDLSLNSDKVLKLIDRRFEVACVEEAEGVLQVVATVKAAQVERLGGDDDY